MAEIIEMQNAREIRGTLTGIQEGKLAILHSQVDTEPVAAGFDTAPKFISDWIERSNVHDLLIDDIAVQVKCRGIRYPSDL